ncbi:IS66-like element accessory protein TnpA [Burkholderia multivorans]|uniref:IS66-like element accessory protein TnpA n=1 Tax=Burkholderia multivorans TaxID=87883 RepID=UPI001C23A2E6|nr:transposase [Burkholderia multivorans]
MGTKLSKEAKRPTRQGRPNHPINFKRRLAQQACEPDVSVAQLALGHGINANLLFKWRRQYRAGQFDAPAKTAAMLPVALINDDAQRVLPGATETPPTPASTVRSAIEVQFTDAVVRVDSGADVLLLRAVLAALR